jgi:hypothetical protein
VPCFFILAYQITLAGVATEYDGLNFVTYQSGDDIFGYYRAHDNAFSCEFLFIANTQLSNRRCVARRRVHLLQYLKPLGNCVLIRFHYLARGAPCSGRDCIKWVRDWTSPKSMTPSNELISRFITIAMLPASTNFLPAPADKNWLDSIKS